MANWKALRKSIPHRVVYAPKKFAEIVWVDDFPDGNTLGETRFDPVQIAIKKGLSDKLTVITYLHEMEHLWSWYYEANLTENQILALEKSFHYRLKKNNIFKDEK